MRKTSTIPDRRRTGRKGLFGKNPMPLSLAAAQGEDYYEVLSPDSDPRVCLYSEADMQRFLHETGRIDPRLVR